MFDFILDSFDDIDIPEMDIDNSDYQYSEFWDSFPEPDRELFGDNDIDDSHLFYDDKLSVSHRGQVSFGSHNLLNGSFNPYGSSQFNPYGSSQFNAYSPGTLYPISHNPGTIMGDITIRTNDPGSFSFGPLSDADAVRNQSYAYTDSWVNDATNHADYTLRKYWADNIANNMAQEQVHYDNTIGLQNSFLENSKRYGFGHVFPSFSNDMDFNTDDESLIDDNVKQLIDDTPEWENMDLAERFELVTDKITTFLDNTGIIKMLKSPSIRASIIHMINQIK